jgi:hypothetical protein
MSFDFRAGGCVRSGSSALRLSALVLLSACTLSLAGIWTSSTGIDAGRERFALSVFIAPGQWVIGFRTLEKALGNPAAYMLSAGECRRHAPANGFCGGVNAGSSCIANNRFYVCLFVGAMRSECLASVGHQDPVWWREWEMLTHFIFGERRGAAMSHRAPTGHVARLHNLV